MTIHEVTFDSTDVDELVQRFTLSELRRMLDKTEADSHADAFFQGTPYADAKPFPNADFAESVRLAIDAKRAATPTPTYHGNGKRLDIDRARSTDIVTVAGRYIVLRKSGTRFMGLCPLHNDSNPSFVVFTKNNSWHCFGCNRGGDTIGLVMLAENCDFRTAVERLGG